jgi:hypothetical protein
MWLSRLSLWAQRGNRGSEGTDGFTPSPAPPQKNVELSRCGVKGLDSKHDTILL